MATENFRIRIPDETLEDLRDRLGRTRWPHETGDCAWARGTEPGCLRDLVTYWRDGFDWRAQEARLNRWNHFRCDIGGTELHFIHAPGKGSSPLPLILTHGWPDSFLRYRRVIDLLADPAAHGGSEEDAFDVVVPSLPGFGFSALPENGVNNFAVSELWAKLMTGELGYAKFAAAGGDIGSGVTRYLALNHPDLLVGIHLTDVGIIRSLLNEKDPGNLPESCRQYIHDARDWLSMEAAYMTLQSTKPQTLAFGLSDSPAGLAAWILEKFHSWSDPDRFPQTGVSRDELLTNIMLYWVTDTIGSSVRMYYENSHTLPPMGPITVPVGIALFPRDILPPPREWVAENMNLVRWTDMPRRGHFTALEEPELFAQELRAFFRPLR